MSRILGIDFGQARIGLAVSDELHFLAHPLETIHLAETKSPSKRVAEVVREKEVTCIIVGLPRHMNGTLGVAAADAQAFVDKLKTMVACEVKTWDERLSTVAANRALRESGRKTRETRGIVDQVAAQMILQGYLDSIAGQGLPAL